MAAETYLREDFPEFKNKDPMFVDAALLVVLKQKCSITFLQKSLGLPYERAISIFKELKNSKIISIRKGYPEGKILFVNEIQLFEYLNYIMNTEIKKCPYCAEDIKAEAIVCKHCGRDLEEEESQQVVYIKKGATIWDGVSLGCGIFIILPIIIIIILLILGGFGRACGN